MKISSASKKVLASALSAAMVVAFAPTVAFAAGTTAKVNFSAGAGQVKDGKYAAQFDAKDGQDLTVDTKTGKVTLADTNVEDIYELNGYAFDEWVLDANKNGVIDKGEKTVAEGGQFDAVVDQTYNLIASYKVPKATATLAVDTIKTPIAANDLVDATVSVTNLKAGSYKATLTKGAETIAGASNVSDGKTATKFAFKLGKTAISAGDYVFTAYDKDGKEIASDTVTVCKVNLDLGEGYGTFAPGSTTEFYVTKDTALTGGKLIAEVVTDGTAFEAWATSNGDAVSDNTGKVTSYTVTSDVTFYATYANKKVKVAKMSDLNELQFQAANLAKPDGTKHTGYKAVLTGPNGFSKTILESGAGVGLTKTYLETGFTIKFGATTPTYLTFTEQLAAGTYTMAIEPVWADGYTPTASEAKAVAVAPKSVTLAALSYDVGEGVDKKDTTKAFDTKGLPKVAESGVAMLKDIADAINGNTPGTKPSSVNTFDAWTIGGKAVSYDTVVTGDIVVKATYKNTKLAAPTYTVTPNGTKFDVVFNVPAGITLKVNGTAITSGTKATFDASAAGNIKADAQKSGMTDGTVTLVPYVAGTLNAFTTFVDGVLVQKTSKSSAAKAVVFGDSAAVKATKAAGEAAIKGIGYAEQSAWDATLIAEKKKVLDAAAAAEKANIEAAAALVKSADGKTYTYATQTDIDKALKAVDDVIAAFVENMDGDATSTDIKTAAGTVKGSANISGADYAKAIAFAADVTTTTVDAAVAEPVIAVNDQLAAAKTGAEAKAAIEAFNKLTAEQKKLVDAATVAAAQELATAQEVKDAQDDAAVSKTRDASKTVKAGKNGKTTKKQSVTLKKITSKSGAKVTYKKSSGSSKVTVKSGKAYLAKGVKKGTYKATVKATCGTQTAKIKVTFKVK